MLERISTTGDEPVTVEEAKRAARIDGDDLDADLARMIRSARGQAEHITGRSYVTSVWRESLQAWPSADQPVAVEGASACAISYWSGTGWVNLLPADFVFAAGPCGGTVVAPSVGKAWPALGAAAVGPRVRIDVTAGDPTVRPAPACVQDYICAHVATWVKNPEALASATLVPHALFERLLDSEMVY